MANIFKRKLDLTAYITDEQLRGEENRFNLLRLFAAYLVIVTHSSVLFRNSSTDFYTTLTGQTTGGQLAVSIFFIISGFLIYRSAVNARGIGFYLFSRASRLYPAAFACSIVTVFGVGLAFTTLDVRDYLSNWHIYHYIRENTFLFGVEYLLPGVFKTNVGSQAINGSLWTIPYEIKMYLFCALGVFVLRKRWVFFIAAAALFIFSACENPQFGLFGKLEDFIKHSYAYYFFAGATIYILRHRIPLNGYLLAALGIVYIGSFHTVAVDCVQKVFLPYAVIYAALAYPRWQLRRWAPPDISYGVYIYGFPIQQSVSHLYAQTHSFAFCFVLATSIITALALLSWYMIEKPVLDNKSVLYRHMAKLSIMLTQPFQPAWRSTQQFIGVNFPRLKALWQRI